MAGRMISELSDATSLQNTDLIPLARGATTLKVSGLTLASSISSTIAPGLSSLMVPGLTATAAGAFITKPASASAQQILTYDGATTTWVASAAPAGGTGATGGGSDKIFWENGQTVTANYTITTGKNAMTAGPITVAAGVTVTVPSGSVWTVV